MDKGKLIEKWGCDICEDFESDLNSVIESECRGDVEEACEGQRIICAEIFNEASPKIKDAELYEMILNAPSPIKEA